MKLKIDKSNWKKVRLGDVATEYSKRINNPSKSEFDRFVGSSNIGQWDFRIQSWESTDSVTSAMKLFEPNDYLLVRRSLYASDFRERAPRATFSGVCSGDILTIKENPKKVIDGFLIGILNSPSLWKYVVANASGSITRRIKWKDLANYEFLLPPKDEQAKLAELLWAMDEVIERHEQLLIINKNFLESNLNSLVFGQYGYSKMKKTKIGEIPDKWNLKKLGDLCLKIGDGIHKTPEYVEDSEYLFVNGNNLIDNKITKTESTKCVSYSEFEKYNKKLALGSILLSINGTIGNLAFYQGEDVVFGKSVAYMSVNEKELDPLFLYYLLQTNKIKTFYERELTGSTISNLSLKTIRSTPIPLPSISEQKNISQKVKLLFESGEAVSKTNVTSKALQKSLINQIF